MDFILYTVLICHRFFVADQRAWHAKKAYGSFAGPCRRSPGAVEEFLWRVAAGALLGCLIAYRLHLISLTLTSDLAPGAMW